ncbi:MAG: HAD-IA family hydrolase [Actinomycetota bacterium]|nr:HAD-IA family hydrolase [Actinomycetota bacterium]
MATKAVLLDFYGTLAEMVYVDGSWDVVVAAAGYTLDRQARATFWDGGIDGTEHDSFSQSRDHYVAWQRSRTRAMLAGSGVPDAEQDALVDELHTFLDTRDVVTYDDVIPVLRELRDRGVVLAICSNWDWDLREAIDAAGLTGLVDVVVSSAWIGARKPHPRIFSHTLGAVGVDPADALFVGDTWRCDVEGPRAFGMPAVYVRRDHFGVDHSAPDDAATHADVVHTADLTVLLDLVARTT